MKFPKKMILANALIVLIAGSFATMSYADDKEMVKCLYSHNGQESEGTMTQADCKKNNGKEVKVMCKGVKEGKTWKKDLTLKDCTKEGGTEVTVRCKGKTNDKEWIKDTSYDECKRLDGSELEE